MWISINNSNIGVLSVRDHKEISAIFYILPIDHNNVTTCNTVERPISNATTQNVQPRWSLTVSVSRDSLHVSNVLVMKSQSGPHQIAFLKSVVFYC